MYLELSITFFHSQDALDLLGTLLTHQVLKLLVLPGIPERKTGDKRERDGEVR